MTLLRLHAQHPARPKPRAEPIDEIGDVGVVPIFAL